MRIAPKTNYFYRRIAERVNQEIVELGYRRDLHLLVGRVG